MSKARLAALILSILFALTGVGYAYWSESIAIESTVTTGHLLVEFIDQSREPPFPYLFHPYSFPQKFTYPEFADSLKLLDDNHTLTATYHNFFPGINYDIPFAMENNGTIPARFKKCLVTCDIIDPALSPDDKSRMINELYEHILVTNLSVYVYNTQGNRRVLQIANGQPAIKLGELDSYLAANTSLAALQLVPAGYEGENKISGEIAFRFGEGLDNSFENRQLSISVGFDWMQFNEY